MFGIEWPWAPAYKFNGLKVDLKVADEQMDRTLDAHEALEAKSRQLATELQETQDKLAKIEEILLIRDTVEIPAIQREASRGKEALECYHALWYAVTGSGAKVIASVVKQLDKADPTAPPLIAASLIVEKNILESRGKAEKVILDYSKLGQQQTVTAADVPAKRKAAKKKPKPDATEPVRPPRKRAVKLPKRQD